LGKWTGFICLII